MTVKRILENKIHYKLDVSYVSTASEVFLMPMLSDNQVKTGSILYQLTNGSFTDINIWSKSFTS